MNYLNLKLKHFLHVCIHHRKRVLISSILFLSVGLSIYFYNLNRNQSATITGPIAYWKLDEGQGTTTQDQTSNNYDGTFGIGTGASSPSWSSEEQCISGKCLRFDGSDDYVSFGDINNIDSSSAFSVSMWVKFNKLSDWSMVFSKKNSSSEKISMGLSGAGDSDSDDVEIMVDNGASPDYAVTTGNIISTGTWNHWMMVFNGRQSGNSSRLKFYFNGVEQTLNFGGTTIPAATGNNSSPVYVGSEGVGTYSNTFIDEVKVYDYARTAIQVKQDFTGGGSKGSSVSIGKFNQKGLSTGLVGYWNMDDTKPGATILDKSGNGNIGTFSSAPETGTAETASTTTTAVDADNTSLSTNDDAYNGMQLEVTGGCGITAGVYREIIDYAGSTRTITVDSPFLTSGGTALDNCTFTIHHTTSSGKMGFGLEFEGSSDEVLTVPDSSSLSVTGGLSVSAWIKPESNGASTQYDIAGKFDGSNESYLLAQYGDEIRFYIDSSSNYAETLNTNLTVGEWYHVVGVYNPADQTVKIYVNNVVKDTTVTGTIPASIGDDGGRFQIGSEDTSTAPTNFYDGTIDEVRVYNKALSQNAVDAIFKFRIPPALYYSFDEGSGTTTIIDHSGNERNGTISGTATQSNWVRGKFGGAYSFNGTDNYISVPNSASMAGRSQFTITAWIRPRQIDATQYLIYGECIQGNACNTRINFNIQTDNQLRFGGRDDDNAATVNFMDDNSRDLTPYVNQWIHVAAVFDSQTDIHKIYLNGSPLAASTGTDPIDGGNHNSLIPRIGSAPSGTGGNFFPGEMDEFKIFHYALSDAQIIEEMNAGHPTVGTPIGSTVMDLKMDEGYGTFVNDWSPQNNDATMGTGSSAPTWLMDGKFGKALFFDGTSDYATVSSNTTLTFDNVVDFSIFAWVKRLSTGANHYIVSKEDADNDGYRLWITSGNIVQCSLDTIDISSTSTITDTNWHHVGCVIDRDGNGQIYLDGKADGTATAINSEVSSNTANLHIGSRSYGRTSFFKGWIDDLRIYPAALTADNVKTVMNQGEQLVLGSTSTESNGTTPSNSSSREYCVPGDTSTCNAPIGEWKLNEANGTTAYDTSGNSRIMTMKNMSSQSWTKGKIASALKFDGSDDYLCYDTNQDGTCEISTPLQLTGDMSFGAWIKAFSMENDERIVHIGDFSENQVDNTLYSLFWSGTGGDLGYHHEYSTGTNENITFDTNLATNTWYYVYLTRNVATNTVSLYINGVLKSAQTYTTDPNGGGNGVFTLGTYYNANGLYFDGIIDDAKLYNYVRTPAQVAWEYNKGKPFAWYLFDECTGTNINDWGTDGNGGYNGKNGTLDLGSAGTTTSGTCTTSGAWFNGATGKYNAGMDFDGNDDIVRITDDDIFSFINGISDIPFSITLWVNRDGNQGYLVSKSDVATTTEYRLFLTGTALQFELSNPGGNISRSTTSLFGATTWHHIAATYDGSESNTGLKIYIDGQEAASTAAAGGSFPGMSNSSTNVTIGARTNGASIVNPFNGRIDDVRIYNYALTPQQIKAAMNDGTLNFQ